MIETSKKISIYNKECTFCNRQFIEDYMYSAKFTLNKEETILGIQTLDIIICKDCMLEIYENEIYMCANCKLLYLLHKNNYYTSYFDNLNKFCKKCFIKNTFPQ